MRGEDQGEGTEGEGRRWGGGGDTGETGRLGRADDRGGREWDNLREKTSEKKGKVIMDNFII